MAEAGGHGDFKLITEGLAGGWKGDNVTLPCHLSPETSASSMTIRWFKESECIYLYKNGQVIEGRGYEGRLTLNIQDLQKGNVSLTLRDYRDTDKGVYICQVKHGEQEEEIAVGLTGKSVLGWDGGVKAEAKAYLSKETAEQKNRRLNSAHVFATQLEQQFLQKYQEQLKKGWELCKVIFPYEALHEDELSIKEGEIVAIVSKDCGETGWWMGEIGGRQGVFPDNFVKMLVPDVEKERPKKPPLPTAPSAKLTTEMATEQRKLTQEVEKLTAQLKQRDDQLKKKDEELRMMERDDVTTEENRLGVEQLQITLTTERELQNYTKEMAAEQRKLTQEVEKLTAQLRQRDDQLEKKDEDTSGVEQRKITEMKEDFMKKNWTELVKRVTEVQGVLDDLLREDFLSEETTSNIKAEGTSEAKVRMLHDIMKKKGKKAMSAFYDALQKHEKHLVKDLKEEGHH